MMLILAGSVRLWTGRTLSALERLQEAQSLFVEITDDFGQVQSAAVLGRALVLAGRVDEGLELVAGLGDADAAEPMTERNQLLAVMAGMAATVQVGDVDRTERLLSRLPGAHADGDTGQLIGDTERATAMTLHQLQLGDVTEALRVAGRMAQAIAPSIDPNLHSAYALALASDGQVDAAISAAEAVDQHPRASYLDKITAGVARSLALARAASARGGSDAARRHADADGRLLDLGIPDTAWRVAYAQALGLTV
jgi:hypothetical protein